MTGPAGTVQQAITAALDARNPDDIISGVKAAVAEEMRNLSPGASISLTSYFNHTYMPDMVLSWGHGKNAETRPIYLRDRLDPAPTQGDVKNLQSKCPVFLGFAHRTDPSQMRHVRDSANQTSRVLVTDVDAIGRLIDTNNEDAGQASNPGPSPIVGLVRNNILRAGRGLMTAQDAGDITEAASTVSRAPTASDTADAASRLGSLQRIASDVFAEDGVFQLMRAATLLQTAISPAQTAGFQEYSNGALTESELRAMLPYLLKLQGPVESNDAFWRSLSQLINIETLLALSEIDGLDVSRLVTNEALNRWTANRAELVLNNDDDVIDGRTIWTVSNGLLCATVGHWRVLLATKDNRKLRGRDDSTPADWADLEPVARGFLIDSASLRGITRRFQVGVEQSTDIATDVSRIVTTLPDAYRVQAMDVRIPGEDNAKPIEIDFRRMLASVKGSRTSIAALATAALLLLGYRDLTYAEWLLVAPDET